MKKILTTILVFLGLLTIGASVGASAAGISSKTIDISTSTFTEINSSGYGTKFTHTYSVENVLDTTTKTVDVEAYGVYKNGTNIQMNKGKGTYIKNLDALPGAITKIVLTWTATGKNSPTIYLAKDAVASTTSQKMGTLSNTQTVQTLDVNYSDGYKYFYFDGTTVTGACYLTNFEITYSAALNDSQSYVTFKNTTTDAGVPVSLSDTGVLSSIPENPTAPENQIFIGWKDETSGTIYTAETLATATFSGNTTVLVAQFRNKTIYKVSYFDGENEMVVDAVYKNLHEGDKITYKPKKAGFVFDGWYKEKELTNPAELTLPKGAQTEVNLNLYAKWLESPYTLITSINELVDASYILSATYSDIEHFVGDYVDSTFHAVASPFDALSLYFEKQSNDTYTIAYYDANNKANYLGMTDETNLTSAQTFTDLQQFQWEVAVDSEGLFTFTNNQKSNRGITYRNDLGHFKVNSTSNIDKANYQFRFNLYKIDGSDKDASDYFALSSTKSSLKITYDVDLNPIDVDLRLGGIIDDKAYHAGATYGVLVGEGFVSLTAGKTAYASVADFLTAHAGFKNVECKATDIGGKYQFAWVITDMEGHYDSTLTAVMYMVYNGNLYICSPKTTSVKATATEYLNDTSLGLKEDQKAVLNKIIA